MKKRKQKIVFLINDITALGGTERMCTLIADQLARLGFEVTIISQHESNKSTFFPLDSEVKRQQIFPKRKGRIHHFQLPFSLYHTIKKIQPAIIISCDTQMCLYSSIPLIGKNHIAWEHFNSSIVTRFGSRWFGRRLASFFCKKIIVLTQSDKTHWIEHLQTDSDKITIIPNPIPIEPKPHDSNKMRKKIVLAVGRMTAQKGFDLLIESWIGIDKAARKDWKLRIVGPSGSARPELEKRIRDHQIAKEIELAKEACDIESEYQQASIYVLSSRYEGFGLTLLEAMGQGLPVIAFDCPMGPGEILENKYGKLLPAQDIEQLSQSLKLFMSQPELRAEYSKLAFTRSKAYSTENIMLLWQSMLHQF